MTTDQHARTIGLRGATTIGVGAIVGGGIMVLAGVAFASAGPAAIVAFALNGAVAFITALSFAEVATRFPESGGAYTFAKKVMSVRMAFAVGWVLWFAYIVAGVLYALGFSTFALAGLQTAWSSLGGSPPAWLASRDTQLFLAVAATAAYAISLVRRAEGGGDLATIGKVIVFAIMIVVGIVAVIGQPVRDTWAALDPFFTGGVSGVISAMGFTFIALQGFDLIPAVGGEVKDPERTIPRAMFLSLALAMAIYLPLLFVTSVVGVGAGGSIVDLAKSDPDTVFATAVGHFMGRIGYWLVIVAAVLSTLSALHANLLAASRVSLAMARDRTLPVVLGTMHERLRTPIMAVYATALTLVAILFMVPDLGAAGAAASLIFLISFAMVHVTTYLARRRGDPKAARFLTPYFPLIPVAGGIACAALAAFQAVVVPSAGSIALMWLGLGLILYVAIFKGSAETVDASAEAFDPELAKLRGKNPLVLLPIANPAHASSMMAVASAMAPREVGRVLLLSIVRTPDDTEGDLVVGLRDAQQVLQHALTTSYQKGNRPEALITAASDPWREIRRVATAHDCESVLLGLSDRVHQEVIGEVESLINDLDCDVAMMRVPADWKFDDARRILVPIGGAGAVHEMRARMLGAICRGSERSITFARVVPAAATDVQVAEALRETSTMAEAKVPGAPTVRILRSDDPVAAILEVAGDHDLMIIGVQHSRWGRRTLGAVALRLAAEASCASIIISGRRSQIYSDVYRPLRDVVRELPLLRPGRETKPLPPDPE